MANRDYYEVLLTEDLGFDIMIGTAPRVGLGLSGAFLCYRRGSDEDLY